ncbi:hypothetical protein ABKN59_008269 [Abortiporus biennis]
MIWRVKFARIFIIKQSRINRIARPAGVVLIMQVRMYLSALHPHVVDSKDILHKRELLLVNHCAVAQNETFAARDMSS